MTDTKLTTHPIQAPAASTIAITTDKEALSVFWDAGDVSALATIVPGWKAQILGPMHTTGWGTLVGSHKVVSTPGSS